MAYTKSLDILLVVFYCSCDKLSDTSFIKMRQPKVMTEISLYFLGNWTQIVYLSKYWGKKQLLQPFFFFFFVGVLTLQWRFSLSFLLLTFRFLYWCFMILFACLLLAQSAGGVRWDQSSLGCYFFSGVLLWKYMTWYNINFYFR